MLTISPKYPLNHCDECVRVFAEKAEQMCPHYETKTHCRLLTVGGSMI